MTLAGRPKCYCQRILGTCQKDLKVCSILKVGGQNRFNFIVKPTGTRLGCFYVAARLSLCWVWGWFEAEV